MAALSPKAAVDAGLLVLAPAGTCFPARDNRPLPFIIDSRGAGTNLSLRAMIVDGLTSCLPDLPAFDVIAGMSKAGTTWAAWLAWSQNQPYATVHLDGPRNSGLQRSVEGDVSGKRVLLIDNWFRRGASVEKAVEIMKRAGATPVAALAIVTDGEAEVDGVALAAVWHIDQLLDAAGLAFGSGAS
jgi:orotate phosphoribosyltransferase